MLETEIKKLNESITRLIALLENAAPAAPEQPLVVEDEPTPAPAEAVKEEAPAPADTVRREDLQILCGELVREDRSRKPAILDIVAGFGAKVIAKVPEDKLPELKAALEALR